MQVNDDMVRAAMISFSKNPLSREHPDAVRAALTAALAHMWLNMDSAPKDGERVLLGFRGSMGAEGYWHDGSQNYWKRAGWYFADDDVLTGRPCDPDCYMPLPAPPLAGGE